MPLILIVGIAQILAMQVLMPMNKDKEIVRASILGAVIGVLLNVLLVKSYKSIGTSIVLISSEVIVTGYYVYIVANKHLINIPLKLIFRKIALGITYILGAIPCIYLFSDLYIQVLGSFLSIFLIWIFLNKKYVLRVVYRFQKNSNIQK